MSSIEIPQDLLNRLQQLLPGEQNNQALAITAMTEWIDWLDGSFRPMTMSEMETRRIAMIYRDVLVDQLPTTNNIGNSSACLWDVHDTQSRA